MSGDKDGFDDQTVIPGLTAPEPDSDDARQVQPTAPKGGDPTMQQGPQPPKTNEELENLKAALREERAKRQQMMAEYEDRWKQVQATLQAQQTHPVEPEPQAPAVDFEEDPVTYLKSQNDAIMQRLESYGKREQEKEQVQAQERQWQEFVARVVAHENEFRKQHPDYDEAIGHINKHMTDVLTELGYTPSDIHNALRHNATQIAVQAFRVGDNPAEMAYRVAQKYGYQPKATPAQTPQGPAKKKPPTSLSTGSWGETPEVGDDLSWKDISKMSDQEFDAYFKKVMGGS